MTDLIHLLGQLVSTKGEIKIPGISSLVAPVTADEMKRYEVLDYTVAVGLSSVGIPNQNQNWMVCYRILNTRQGPRLLFQIIRRGC
jgi:hypothetical protein